MNKKSRFSDSELVEAIRGKEMLEQAISQLYQENAEITRSFIMGKGGTEQDADDIFQETVVSFIDTVQKGKFRQESGIRTFLISISKHLWYNEIRKRQRAGNREKIFETERDQEDAGVGEAIQDRELKQQLAKLLSDLGESCKKILELFYYENLSMKEIVSHLHYENEQVVRNKKYKCLQELTDKNKAKPAGCKADRRTDKQMNMKPENEILIDYLDGQMNPEEIARVEHNVENNIATASELLYLKMAIETVRTEALQAKVSGIRQAFENNQTTTLKSQKAIVRSMNVVVMRVAAVLFVLLTSAALYKYASVNNQSIYNRQFSGYDLNVTRGSETPPNVEVQAYRNKNWNEVIAAYSAEAVKSNKSTFLAAMAEMQLSHFQNAVSLFESILQPNAADHSFQDESEYYLSLAYMMNHEEAKSLQMINKIKADTSHTYYPLASKLAPIDLKIMELKNK